MNPVLFPTIKLYCTFMPERASLLIRGGNNNKGERKGRLNRQRGLVETTTGYLHMSLVRWMSSAHTPGRKEHPNQLWLLPEMAEPLQWARPEGDVWYRSSRILSTRHGGRPRAAPAPKGPADEGRPGRGRRGGDSPSPQACILRQHPF